MCRRAIGAPLDVSNHELAGSDAFAVPHLDGRVYDAGGIGGTSTIALEADNSVVHHCAPLSRTRTTARAGSRRKAPG